MRKVLDIRLNGTILFVVITAEVVALFHLGKVAGIAWSPADIVLVVALGLAVSGILVRGNINRWELIALTGSVLITALFVNTALVPSPAGHEV